MSKKLVNRRCLVLTVRYRGVSRIHARAPLSDASAVEDVVELAHSRVARGAWGQVKLSVANVPFIQHNGRYLSAPGKCGTHYGAWRHVAGIYAIGDAR